MTATRAPAARPPVERYVRITIEHRGFTYEPAVEWRDGDDFEAITADLVDIVEATDFHSRHDTMFVARHIGESVIAKRWPDRAYFVEVWQEGRRGFAQVFQPFGVPRNR